MRYSLQPTIFLFLILLYCFLSFASFSHAQTISDNELSVAKIKSALESRFHGNSKYITNDLWARIIYRYYYDSSVPLKSLIDKQERIFKSIYKIYKPNVLAVVAILTSMTEALNQKNLQWKSSHAEEQGLLIDQKFQKWLEKNFFEGLQSTRISIGELEKTLFVLAAVDTSSIKYDGIILIPPSLMEDPLKVDPNMFKRVFYHELYHLYSHPKISNAAEEVNADLFATKALILVMGKQMAREVYGREYYLKENEEYFKDLAVKVDDTTLIKGVMSALVTRRTKQFDQIPDRMFSVAEAEMSNKGRDLYTARAEFVSVMTHLHIERILMEYAVRASVMYVNIKEKIKREELPNDYISKYNNFWSYEKFIIGPTINWMTVPTVRFYSRTFIMMLRLCEMIEKRDILINKTAKGESVGDYIGQLIFPSVFNEQILNQLNNGEIVWLATPMIFDIIPAETLKMLQDAVRSGHPDKLTMDKYYYAPMHPDKEIEKSDSRLKYDLPLNMAY